MHTLDLDGLPQTLAPAIEAFARDLAAGLTDNLLSIAITGSALGADFIPGRSDINSVIVVSRIDRAVLDQLAALGKHHGKKGIRAPLIMTPQYIERSRDVFPVEFLEIKLRHATIYGADHFENLTIETDHLRMQLERDLKARLINLRQGYIQASGRTRDLTALLIEALGGYFPLFRAILVLKETAPAATRSAVLQQIEATLGITTAVLGDIMALRARKRPSLPADQAHAFFEKLYTLTEELSLQIDEHSS